MSADWAGMVGWRLVLPPSRPDRKELQRIAAALSDVPRDLSVGVLGSTPEFRDLLAEEGFTSVSVLEKSETFHRIVDAELIYQCPTDLVLGDWRRTLPALPGNFAVLLSDLTAGNIPYGERIAFYAAVAGALRSGGMFVDKHLVNDVPLLTMEAIGARYREEPFNLRTVNDFSCEAVFCSDLQARLGVVDTTRIYDALELALTTPRLRKFIVAAQQITPPGRTWFYGAPEYRTDPPLERFGLELRERADLDPHCAYSGRAYQYFWVKP